MLHHRGNKFESTKTCEKFCNVIILAPMAFIGIAWLWMRFLWCMSWFWPKRCQRLSVFLIISRGQKLNTNIFSQTFRAPPGYPSKIPGYPAKKVWFPCFRGTYRTFCPPPFTWKTPTPLENIRTQKFGFVLFFRAWSYLLSGKWSFHQVGCALRRSHRLDISPCVRQQTIPEGMLRPAKQRARKGMYLCDVDALLEGPICEKLGPLQSRRTDLTSKTGQRMHKKTENRIFCAFLMYVCLILRVAVFSYSVGSQAFPKARKPNRSWSAPTLARGWGFSVALLDLGGRGQTAREDSRWFRESVGLGGSCGKFLYKQSPGIVIRESMSSGKNKPGFF